ncbi:MAG: DUF309 domain-containing protein [Planctomycetota bacterium]|nr:DUF309 domain-containing protein [Planctomycetota bacterium]
MEAEPTVPQPAPGAAERFSNGVALFNARAFWEAHEAWEDLWLEAEGAHRLWLQGLIQYAAALFHFERGFFASGFQRLMQTATEKTAHYGGETYGINWPGLQAALAPWIEYGTRVAAGATFPVAPAPWPVIDLSPPA